MKNDLNTQLGMIIGEYILLKYLPTLSTDMLHSNTVIKLSDVDTEACETLNSTLNKSYTSDPITKKGMELHKAWYSHQCDMAEKYLPRELVMNIPRVVPEDTEKFEDGIRTTLWDCDLCWYDVDDIKINYTSEFAWCIIITLDLRIKKIK